MRRIIFSLLITLGVFCALPSFAAEIYVSDTGNNTTGDGSSANPYATITQALTIIKGGDTVFCKGTIVDNPIITSAVAGSATAYTTITNWPGNSATINGGGSGHNTIFAIADGANYIKIDGLNITNAELFGINATLFGGHNNHLQITNNTIYGLSNGANAIYTYIADTDSAVISGNNIYGDGDDNQGLWLSDCPDAIVSGNKIHDFKRAGIIIYNNSYNSVVANNWIYNIGGNNSSFSRGGLYVLDTYNLKIYNNVFYNIQDPASYTFAINIDEIVGDTYNVTIRNNIISSVDVGIECDGNAITSSSSDYNIFYSARYIADLEGTTFTTFSQWQTNGYQDLHGLEANPLFISTDPTAYDFHVQTTSPGIDKGQDNIEVLTDYDGEARPYNITDIGADEVAIVAAPENLAAVAAIDSATLTWSMPSGYTASSYIIKVSTDEALTTAAEFTSSSPTFDLSGLSSAGIYYFAVQASYTTDYQSYTSAYSSVYKFVTYPAKVTNIKVPKKYRKTNQVKVKWLKQDNVSGYRINVKNKKGYKINTINIKSNKGARIIKRLKPNRQYQIKIKAKIVVDEIIYWGEWSSVKKFKTK